MNDIANGDTISGRNCDTPSQVLYSRLHIITRDIFICRSGQAFVCLRKCCWVPEGRQRDIEKARPLYLTLRHPSPSRCSRRYSSTFTRNYCAKYNLLLRARSSRLNKLLIEKLPTKTRQLENQVFLFYFYFEFSTGLRLIILVNLP